MPENYFANRDRDSMCIDTLYIGDTVLIIEKEHQGSKDINDLVQGQIVAKLSRHGEIYKNGAKVKIILDPKDWRYKEEGSKEYIGRVQYVIKHVNGIDVK